jgi:hypothetical protein
MQTKTCPSCGAVVPVVAYRCKECFHDLATAKPRKGSPVAILVAVAAMAVASVGTFWYLSQQRTDEQILVDESSRSVQWIKQYADGHLETDRLPFDQVSLLRYEVVSGGEHQIVAVTTDGEEKIVEHTKEHQLGVQAEKYAQMMQKPLQVVDATQKRD